MKKTALTFVAVAFGTCIAFAQTAPQTEKKPAVNKEESVATDKMSAKPAEASLRIIKVEELPAAVQQSLKGPEFQTFTVVTVAEVEGQQDAKGKYFQAALAQEGATEPSLIVLFDEKGKAVAQKEIAEEKQEK